MGTCFQVKSDPMASISFSLDRRILYYILNILCPCIWLNILSLLAFCLPPDAGEKITLGITVLLSYSVFMLLVAESMPPTSEFVPLIGKNEGLSLFQVLQRKHKTNSSFSLVFLLPTHIDRGVSVVVISPVVM